MGISGNRYLSLEEMTINAQEILDYFLDKGWTKESVCGMLGNMQSESTINPGIWESLDEGNLQCGFGLVQWTPASKYISWADSEGYVRDDIEGQMCRIQYEVDNGMQWITKPSYPMSFEEFTKSTENPSYLAEVFINNYERPFEPNQPIRGEQALYWFDTLTGEGGGTNPPKGKYKLVKPYIFCQDDILFGRRIFVYNNEINLVKRVGDMAFITVGRQKFTVPFKNLKKI